MKRIYYFLSVFLLCFSCSFISFMGYMNFKATNQEISEQIFQEIARESVGKIETAMSFGKTLENYYGMHEIFESYQKQVPIMQLFVLTEEGKAEYTSYDEESVWQSAVDGAIEDTNFKNAIKQLGHEEYAACGIGDRNYILQRIENEGKTAGYFCGGYENKWLNEHLEGVKNDIIKQTLILACAAAVLFTLIFFCMEKKGAGEKWEKILSVGLVTAAVVLQSAVAIYSYQASYKSTMMDGAKNILESLNGQISDVANRGVDLSEVEGMADYLKRKVEDIPILWNVKVSEEIANAAEFTGRESSMLLVYNIDGKNLNLEAELSSKYINEKVFQIVLLLTSTLVIMVMMIIELMKLTELILYKFSEFSGKECEQSYNQISTGLRVTSFLCSTAEYICVPYAAMVIRDANASILGLSVGMTAALPLSLEGLAQMVSMLVFPKFAKKMNIKVTLVFSCIMMAVCNLLAFGATGAAGIILFRAIAGVAYAGFKQVSNYLITEGYENELQRNMNLSQDNAGLLGGVTCGAGLGAIICTAGGYNLTFAVSAGVFIVYMIVTLYVIPWRWLKEKAEKKKLLKAEGFNDGKSHSGKIVKMIFSWEMFRYVILIGIPLNIGIMLCVTLLPGICQLRDVSAIILSYCYIANGIAGIYIGPALASKAKKMFGLKRSIGGAFALTAFSIVILKLPMVMVMMILSGMILGFLDGFATPLCADEFMELKVVKETVDESTALIFNVVLSYVLVTVAPVVAELMLADTKVGISPLMIGAICYGVVAVVLMASMSGKRSGR